MDNLIVASVFALAFLFFFPIFVNVNLFFDIETQKLCFGIYLFKFIKLYGGYIILYEEGVVVHYSLTKATLIPFAEVAEQRKKLEITKGFQIMNYSQVIEMGNAYSIDARILVTALFQIVSSQIFSVLQTNKSFLSLNCGTLFLHNAEKLKFSINLVSVFNGLVLSIALTKILIQKVINYGYKRKEQKY